MLKFSEVHVDVQAHHTVCIKYVQVFFSYQLYLKKAGFLVWGFVLFLKNNKDINCISRQEKWCYELSVHASNQIQIQ